MDAISYRHRHLDVACELDAGGVGLRRSEWRDLAARSLGPVEQVPGGARIWFDAAAAETVSELVRKEAQCCGFLDFDLAPDGDRVRLEITSPVAEARGVIEALVGPLPGQ